MAVNVNEGMSGCYPVHWASFKGNTNILGVLLKHGADIKKKGTNWDISALHIAHDAQTVEFLISNGADIEAGDVHGQTPLMWASKLGNLEVAEALLKHGARLDTHDKNDWTALELAQVLVQTNTVTLLKIKGASPSRKGKDDYPYDVVIGSFLHYGTNHPFAQTTLVTGSPLTNSHPIEVRQ